MINSITRADWFPYLAPFAVFLVLLAAGPNLGLGVWEFPVRVLVLALTIYFCSRHVIVWTAPHWMGSVLMGAAVFALWVAPDLLWPGYRQHWIFSNSITGSVASSLPAGFHLDTTVLVFRTIRAAILVPVIEELFWRAWLMRWLMNPDFLKVPLGAYQASSFLITAALFAAEHGPYWEVGLLAGLLYNWWMVRTKSLGDCILAHAVTNAILSAYVIWGGHWEYWL